MSKTRAGYLMLPVFDESPCPAGEIPTGLSRQPVLSVLASYTPKIVNYKEISQFAAEKSVMLLLAIAVARLANLIASLATAIARGASEIARLAITMARGANLFAKQANVIARLAILIARGEIALARLESAIAEVKSQLRRLKLRC